MVDGANYNERVKLALRKDPVGAVAGITARDDAGGDLGAFFHHGNSAVYGLVRPVTDPDCILVTRIVPNGDKPKIDTANVSYDALKAAHANGKLDELLQRAFA